MKGRNPTAAEKDYMTKVVMLGCIVCLEHHGVYSPPEIHHTDGKTKEDAHLRILGLCFNHHRAGQDNKDYTSRHPFKKRFEKRYGAEQELMVITKERIMDSE